VSPRDTAPEDAHAEGLTLDHVRVVRAGHGANCSSIGSVIDTLFATAAVGSAVFAAVLGALKHEDIKVVGATPATKDDADEPPPRAEASS
jgi:hypothetical protein